MTIESSALERPWKEFAFTHAIPLVAPHPAAAGCVRPPAYGTLADLVPLSLKSVTAVLRQLRKERTERAVDRARRRVNIMCLLSSLLLGGAWATMSSSQAWLPPSRCSPLALHSAALCSTSARHQSRETTFRLNDSRLPPSSPPTHG